MKMYKLLVILFLMAIFTPVSQVNSQVPQPSAGSPPLESSATGTPSFLSDFSTDYASFATDKIMKWISPKRGLVQDGILMSYDLTQKKMTEFQKEMKEIKKPGIQFLRGYYNRAYMGNIQGNTQIIPAATALNFYKAFFQLTFELDKYQQKINIIAVFEKIDSKWYLVQTYNLRLARGNINSKTQESLALPTDRLTIGDLPLEFEGTTFSNKPRRFASKMAINRRKPVLLNFFTRVAGDFGAQMDWAETLYPKFKDKNIYIFCVTDDEPDFVGPYLKEGGWKIGVLLDKNSLIHHDLEIDIHPYIILLDHWGVVRAMSRGYNKESLKLVESMMIEIIDEANRAIADEKADGPPKHKY